jgi:hypothetical protein
MLTLDAYSSTGFQTMKPLASCDVVSFGAQYLHLRCGWQIAFPLASYDSLPYHTQSSVPAWWLAFDRFRLSELFTSAFLGTLIGFTPISKNIIMLRL